VTRALLSVGGMRLSSLLTAAVAVVPLLSAVPAQAAPAIDWGSCGDDPALKPFQCATVEVPTDYDRPDGPTTTIALTRLPATDPTNRIGTLFTNPGGPGGPGVDFVQQNALYAYTPQVRARFDILGFDPRGVGRSDPATCFRTQAEEEAFFAGQPAFPVTREQERQATLDNLRLGLQCLTTSPGRFAHMSTANVARDMDLLRQAVGDEKLSYVGYSYGTYLGATYAKLFPGRIRALVLDGTMHPDWYAGSDGDRRPLGARIRQGEGGSEVLAEFNRQCQAAGPDRCSLAKLGDPATVVEQTFQRLKTHPVKLVLPDGTTVTFGYADAVSLTFFSLYAPAGYPGLADLLSQLATAQPAKAPVRLAAGVLPAEVLEQLRRGDDYASVGNGLQPCVESRHTGRPLAYPRYADAEDRRAPHFGRFRTWVGQMCEFIPLRDTDAYRGPWQQTTKDPVLVIGTRFDPATPYQATRPYADLFPAARMLTVDGWGHTTLGVSRCADALITRYLVDRVAPADNSTCAQDRKPFDPLPQTARARLRLL
jgi:pimeloyl-ACP methyl ester carboxylesterase